MGPVDACGHRDCGGDNLTEAAMKAGFASPSHLADRFKTTFGLSASQLLATGLRIRTP
jgi:AraC-like DNA-binding protein